ncbi:MAG: hypothetical protein HY074_14225 [Deltaproteobacteria bacterium]|nr:hypothetical protein [Deltaproteobacteria bacterium]
MKTQFCDPGRLCDLNQDFGGASIPVTSVDASGTPWAGLSGQTGAQGRRLYYWSMRFFVESATEGYRRARVATQDPKGNGFKVPVPHYVNLNNWFNSWASPGSSIYDNYVYNKPVDLSDPKSYCPPPYETHKVENGVTINTGCRGIATGGFDWFHAGRAGAFTLYSEDWNYFFQPFWSYYGDVLRSASTAGEELGVPSQGFGGHVIGLANRALPEAMSYKVLSLAGHGAKTLDLYSFGPQLFQPGEAWSDYFDLYAPIHQATQRLRAAESLLYPGKPARGVVAVQATGLSGIWEQIGANHFYDLETVYLHTALTHAGYTVDFVDDVDISGGALSSRRYVTFYLTQPNVKRAAANAIEKWVAAGGTLVATPGAGTLNEYNEPLGTLDAVLGLASGRTAVRDGLDVTKEDPFASGIFATVTDQLVFTNSKPASDLDFGNSAIALHGKDGPVGALALASGSQAKLVAAVGSASGSPAIVYNPYQKGRAISYGFYPGWEYWLTANHSSTSSLATGWSDAARRVAIAPASKAPRSVVASQPLVEALRLDSTAGTAIVLLNWAGKPLSGLTFTLSKGTKLVRARSIELGVNNSLSTKLVGQNLQVSLPSLKTVDVLLFDTGDGCAAIRDRIDALDAQINALQDLLNGANSPEKADLLKRIKALSQQLGSAMRDLKNCH